MPEQITPLSILYLLLHGAGTAVAVVLFLYLLLCRGKAIAPDITPPARLRRWTAALFGIMAMAHVWWILFYTFLDDTRSLIYGLLVAIDCLALPSSSSANCWRSTARTRGSTCSTAFKQRMHKSVAAWMREEASKL